MNATKLHEAISGQTKCLRANSLLLSNWVLCIWNLSIFPWSVISSVTYNSISSCLSIDIIVDVHLCLLALDEDNGLSESVQYVEKIQESGSLFNHSEF